jgi:proteasome accessory factor B
VPEYQREPDDKTERLLSLTLALLSNSFGFTKDELFGMVREYRNARDDAEKAGSGLDALNKMFERDKESLKNNGVALQWHIPKSEGDDNTQTRYFISQDKFVWPRNFKITSHQLQLLELANRVWSRAALANTTNRGMSKLRALGAVGSSVDLVSIAPKLSTHQPCFLPLAKAAEENRVVQFEYRKNAEETPTTRRIQPWQLYQVGSQWLLIGWDVDKDDRRTFLLKRIVGRVKPLDETFDPIDQSRIEEAKRDLEAHTESQVATLRLREGTAAWTFFDPEGAGTVEHQLTYMDAELLAEELRELGDQVEVLGPASLIVIIRKGLEKVANDHA